MLKNYSSNALKILSKYWIWLSVPYGVANQDSWKYMDKVLQKIITGDTAHAGATLARRHNI